MRTLAGLFLGLVLSVLLGITNPASAVVAGVETFSTDGPVAGWDDSGTPEFIAAGGKGQWTSSAAGTLQIWVSSSMVQGDWVAAGIQRISFDFTILDEGQPLPSIDPFFLGINFGNPVTGSAHWTTSLDPNQLALGVETTFDIIVSEENGTFNTFSSEIATFDDLLQNVEFVDIFVRPVGAASGTIDNFTLAVPEPTTSALVLAATLFFFGRRRRS